MWTDFPTVADGVTSASKAVTMTKDGTWKTSPRTFGLLVDNVVGAVEGVVLRDGVVAPAAISGETRDQLEVLANQIGAIHKNLQEPGVEAHRLGDGTLLKGLLPILLQYLPTLLKLLGGLGVPVPTV